MKRYIVAFRVLIIIIAIFLLLFHFKGFGLFHLNTLPLLFAIALPLSIYTSHTWKFGISTNLLIVFIINVATHLTADQTIQPFSQYLSEFIVLVSIVVPATFCGRYLREFITEYNLVASLFVNKKIPHLDDVRPLIESEFARGTRYNYPISMVLVQSNTDQNTALQEKAEYLTTLFRERLADTELSSFLFEKSRITDILVKSEEENDYLLICPGTDRISAEQLIERLKNVQENGKIIAFHSTIAEFPDDARSFGSLLDYLKNVH